MRRSRVRSPSVPPLFFDASAVARGLEKLGARLVSADAKGVRFRSPEGLGVELLPVDPARGLA